MFGGEEDGWEERRGRARLALACFSTRKEHRGEGEHGKTRPDINCTIFTGCGKSVAQKQENQLFHWTDSCRYQIAKAVFDCCYHPPSKRMA